MLFLSQPREQNEAGGEQTGGPERQGGERGPQVDPVTFPDSGLLGASEMRVNTSASDGTEIPREAEPAWDHLLSEVYDLNPQARAPFTALGLAQVGVQRLRAR